MTSANGFEGKTALVTGAGRGIGRGCALHLAQAGAQVIAVARTESDLDTLAAEPYGDRITPWVDDVAAAGFYRRIEDLDALDILVNNAGMNRPKIMDEVDDDTLDDMIALNVRAVYKTAQAATRVMVKTGGGAVVNMSSQMAHVGGLKRTVYCMTKAAIEGLTKAMALELAEHNIRVNAVAPTFVETPMTRPMFDNPEFKELVFSSIPLRRLAQVEDVAQAVAFLASDAASMVTGTSLLVDGGWTAR